MFFDVPYKYNEETLRIVIFLNWAKIMHYNLARQKMWSSFFADISERTELKGYCEWDSDIKELSALKHLKGQSRVEADRRKCARKWAFVGAGCCLMIARRLN